jgi:hypothetical protein
MRVIFYTPWLFKIFPEVWRLATPFMLTSGGIGFIFDLYFCKSFSGRSVVAILKLMNSSSMDVFKRS